MIRAKKAETANNKLADLQAGEKALEVSHCPDIQ